MDEPEQLASAISNFVSHLRDLGWREEQVAEAVHVAAMMGFCNHIANAFGLPAQNLLAQHHTALL